MPIPGGRELVVISKCEDRMIHSGATDWLIPPSGALLIQIGDYYDFAYAPGEWETVSWEAPE